MTCTGNFGLVKTKSISIIFYNDMLPIFLVTIIPVDIITTINGKVIKVEIAASSGDKLSNLGIFV